MFSLGSTYQELGGGADYQVGGRAAMGGCELGWQDRQYSSQHGARYILSVPIPRDGPLVWPMRSCTFLEPLSTQAICRPGLFSGGHGEDVLSKYSI
jgi:hypothetical protein